jgi:hypothetical protein
MRYTVIKKIIKEELQIDQNFLKLLMLKVVMDEREQYPHSKNEKTICKGLDYRLLSPNTTEYKQ